MACGTFGLADAQPTSQAQPASPSNPWAAIERRLPPPGIELNAQQQQRLAELTAALKQAERDVDTLSGDDVADAHVLVKAVRLAIDHGEIYKPADLGVVNDVLDAARQRIADLRRGEAPWTRQTGLVVRGYVSSVDGSTQPYGLEIPEGLSDKPRLLVWLHGRGDRTTDVHFIHQRMRRAGQAQLPNAIVLHPFGRQCVGFKSAGETDVLEAVEHVVQRYGIDRERIVLMGFSMGGAGAWHLGAHYADHWAAVSPGAGFAETKRYNRIAENQLPNSIEQALWGVNDVPGYVRNLFNVPVVAYSGELDKQIQAARVMEEAYEQEGRTLPHRIGPGMGHKYHPDTLKSLLGEMAAAADAGRPRPQRLSLQTQTLRYSRMYWAQVTGLQRHWQDSRVDAAHEGDQVEVTTKNVRRLRLDPWRGAADHTVQLKIDGQALTARTSGGAVELAKQGESWQVAEPAKPSSTRFEKRPGLQGPIDDAFQESFLVVRPNPGDSSPAGRWAEGECRHFESRWRALMRGDARVKLPEEVTEDDLASHHLVLWGTPQSNPWIQKVLETERLPLRWSDGRLTMSGQWDGNHAPALIYPNPLRPERYVVINSGLTFRENHDRTNSLQNPKLGDWAVIDITRSPDAEAPGAVKRQGFFDESWQLE
ncbi:MAG: prolyl oligopeptidase family serine peptidase [Planctomycetales bacterium]|nr:prolyl oligopeptidase family serine peptidase [Planctomycetales bacterium]